ncbi:MAG: acetyl-CoA carboxylase biotin carboxyl carrier protein [SAR86 cluster bacterium]|jgi:acetyl-CoA carboxylase biotin carboxyl carrier protein|nr:acetyl-CoA carboxylase biotin carboxyl carrier protein [SAR86 cluster bacterium]
MDIRKVKKLIEMLESSELEEIEIHEGEESVRLVKNKTETVVTHQVQPNQLDKVVESSEQPQKSAPLIENSEGEVITSPMVGTFYAAASPGAKPFISVGDEIQEGDVVCIVEAMKMMNEIKSDYSGKVVSVLAENSEPVEFGQALFVIA